MDEVVFFLRLFLDEVMDDGDWNVHRDEIDDDGLCRMGLIDDA